MFKPIQVKALENYRLEVKYSDGVEGVVSLAHLVGKGIFKEWENYDNFKNVTIDPESHALAWGKNIDICPDTLYFDITGITPEEFFNFQPRRVVNA